MVQAAIEAVVVPGKAGDDESKAPVPNSARRRVLPAVRDVTLVATIYLFFAGFVFRYFYLRLLGVSPNEIDLSVNVLMVLAFNVFLSLPWLPVVAVAALAVLAVPKVRALVDVAFAPLVAAVVIGGFFVLFFGARTTAIKFSSIVRDGYGVPAVVMKTRDDSRYDQDFRDATAGGGRGNVTAYLVDQNASTYFVLVGHEPQDPARPDRMYSIPRADVFYVAALLPARR